MIFPHTADKVLTKTKTQTLRLALDEEVLRPGRCGYGVYAERAYGTKAKWIVGRTYALQRGKGGRGIARIRIKSIAPVAKPMEEVDDRFAQREGFISREAFLIAWQWLHRKRANQPAWAIRFELAL